MKGLTLIYCSLFSRYLTVAAMYFLVKSNGPRNLNSFICTRKFYSICTVQYCLKNNLNLLRKKACRGWSGKSSISNIWHLYSYTRTNLSGTETRQIFHFFAIFENGHQAADQVC